MFRVVLGDVRLNFGIPPSLLGPDALLGWTSGLPCEFGLHVRDSFRAVPNGGFSLRL